MSLLNLDREDLELRTYKTKLGIRPKVPPVEARDAGGLAVSEGGSILEGYGAVFNEPVEFGDLWQEILVPGCFDESLASNDVVSMWNHSSQFLLGRQSSGTLKLAVDDYGLKMSLDLPLGTYIGDYVKTMTDRGDVYGASIMFWVEEGDDEWILDAKPYKRLIKKVNLIESGPVYEPANPLAKVAMRRMKDLLERRPPAVAPVEARSAGSAWGEAMHRKLRALSL